MMVEEEEKDNHKLQISNNTAVWGSVFLFSVFLGKTKLNIFLTVGTKLRLGIFGLEKSTNSSKGFSIIRPSKKLKRKDLFICLLFTMKVATRSAAIINPISKHSKKSLVHIKCHASTENDQKKNSVFKYTPVLCSIVREKNKI